MNTNKEFNQNSLIKDKILIIKKNQMMLDKYLTKMMK